MRCRGERPHTNEETKMTTKTNAAAVSATLRRAGFNPLGSGTPTTREGLRVKRSGDRVYVVADLDANGASRRMAQDARDAMTEAGYETEGTATAASFYVIGRA
jgi:hypothetical protein